MDKVRYCYWTDGMDKPDGLPPNCEWQLTPESEIWRPELCSPFGWTNDYKRRWPSRMDAFDDLFIRACKNLRLNTVYRFKRIMAKRCAIETKYVGMYNVTMHLWDIIGKYGIAPSLDRVVQEFMRPLYAGIKMDNFNGLCSKDAYPDFGSGRDQILASFLIATNIIRHSEVKNFPDLSRTAWFKNKYNKKG